MDAPRTRVRLRVSPGARQTAVVGRHGNAWKVRVTAAAEGGHANAAVVRLLAETLAVPRSSITLVSGLAARDNVAEIGQISHHVVERRLASAGQGVRP